MLIIYLVRDCRSRQEILASVEVTFRSATTRILMWMTGGDDSETFRTSRIMYVSTMTKEDGQWVWKELQGGGSRDRLSGIYTHSVRGESDGNRRTGTAETGRLIKSDRHLYPFLDRNRSAIRVSSRLRGKNTREKLYEYSWKYSENVERVSNPRLLCFYIAMWISRAVIFLRSNGIVNAVFKRIARSDCIYVRNVAVFLLSVVTIAGRRSEIYFFSIPIKRGKERQKRFQRFLFLANLRFSSGQCPLRVPVTVIRRLWPRHEKHRRALRNRIRRMAERVVGNANDRARYIFAATSIVKTVVERPSPPTIT